MRLLVYNTEGKIFGKLPMHVETPRSAGVTADSDPPRIWTPFNKAIISF